jgi:hypothetical protein
MDKLPNRNDPVRIVVETPGRHLRAYQRSTIDPSGADKLLAIARINPDGSGWTVSTRGGRTQFVDELQARMFMLALLDDQGGEQ